MAVSTLPNLPHGIPTCVCPLDAPPSVIGYVRYGMGWAFAQLVAINGSGESVRVEIADGSRFTVDRADFQVCLVWPADIADPPEIAA